MEIAFHDMFVHGLDLSAALVGHPESVRSYIRDCEADSGLAATLLLKLADGAESVLHLITGSMAYHVDIGLALSDGSFATIKTFRTLSILTRPTWSGTEGSIRDQPALTWDVGQYYRGYGRHGYAEELDVFAMAIHEGAVTPTNVREEAKVIETLEACLMSAREGREVKIG